MYRGLDGDNAQSDGDQGDQERYTRFVGGLIELGEVDQVEYAVDHQAEAVPGDVGFHTCRVALRQVQRP